MKTRSLIIFSLVALFSASCNKNVDQGTVWDNPNFVRITVFSEPMRTMSDNIEVNWARMDKLMVFDQDNVGYELGTTDVTTRAIFYSYAWGGKGKTPRYAAYSKAPQEGIACTADGVMSVMLDGQQPVKAMNAYADNAIVSVGKITGNSTAYKIGSMKNISGLIKVAMSDPTAASITVEAIGGEIMAGYVDVDYAKIVSGEPAFWSPTPGKPHSSSVTITPVEGSDASTPDGCLKTGAYYVAVLPQFYAEGLRITVRYSDGSTLVRTLGATDGITVPRSNSEAFEGTLDDTLPDVITIRLAFDNEAGVNPLGTFVATAAQGANGEEYTYTYNYTLDNAPATKDFTFTICKGASNATYQHFQASGLDHKVLLFGAANDGWIKLPGIPGRYLKSVSMSHGNTTAKRFRLQEESKSPVGKYFSSPLLASPSLTTPVTETITIPTTATLDTQIINTIEGKSYTMQMTTGSSLRIFDITVVYSKTLEE